MFVIDFNISSNNNADDQKNNKQTIWFTNVYAHQTSLGVLSLNDDNLFLLLLYLV